MLKYGDQDRHFRGSLYFYIAGAGKHFFQDFKNDFTRAPGPAHRAGSAGGQGQQSKRLTGLRVLASALMGDALPHVQCPILSFHSFISSLRRGAPDGHILHNMW